MNKNIEKIIFYMSLLCGSSAFSMEIMQTLPVVKYKTSEWITYEEMRIAHNKTIKTVVTKFINKSNCYDAYNEIRKPGCGSALRVISSPSEVFSQLKHKYKQQKNKKSSNASNE